MVRGGSRISARAIWANGIETRIANRGREAAKAGGHHLGLREVDLGVCRELHGALQRRSVQDPIEVAGASCIELASGLEIEAVEGTRLLHRREGRGQSRLRVSQSRSDSHIKAVPAPTPVRVG